MYALPKFPGPTPSGTDDIIRSSERSRINNLPEVDAGFNSKRPKNKIVNRITEAIPALIFLNQRTLRDVPQNRTEAAAVMHINEVLLPDNMMPKIPAAREM